MISIGHSLKFSLGKPLPVLLRNFYDPEEGYVWSTSKWCEIVFPFADIRQSGSLDLILDLDVFKAPPEFPNQPIMIYLNGMRLAQYDVRGQQTLVMALTNSTLKAEDNSLVIDTPLSARPSIFGVNDERTLGIQLFSAQIQAS